MFLRRTSLKRHLRSRSLKTARSQSDVSSKPRLSAGLSSDKEICRVKVGFKVSVQLRLYTKNAVHVALNHDYHDPANRRGRDFEPYCLVLTNNAVQWYFMHHVANEVQVSQN